MNVNPGDGFLQYMSGLDFTPGNCDVCKQKNVKVTYFHCKSHFYCRSCLEFAPKFRRSKDFSCPTCCQRSKKRTSDTLNEVDKFMRRQTETRPSSNFEEVVFRVGGSSYVSWNKDCDVSDDESDLTGNNDEWDSLLETMSRNKEQQTTSGVAQTLEDHESSKTNAQREDNSSMVKFSTKPGIMGMAPATSYLQLKLPTAGKYGSQSSGSSSSATSSTSSQTSTSDIPNKTNSVLLYRAKQNKSSRSVSSVSSGSVCKSSDDDDGDRLEVKGSARVAGRYLKNTRCLYDVSPENYPDERKKRPNTPVSSRTSSCPACHTRFGSGTSFECWMEELGRIEGPSFKDNDVTFSSNEKMLEAERDDFWDM